MGKALQSLVRPEFGFTEFAQLDQHSDLSCPGSHVLRIKFQYFRIEPQPLFEIRILKSASCFGKIISLAFNQLDSQARLVVRFLAKLKIVKPAHKDWRLP